MASTVTGSSWSDILAAVRVANLLFRSRRQGASSVSGAGSDDDDGPILLQEDLEVLREMCGHVAALAAGARVDGGDSMTDEAVATAQAQLRGLDLSLAATKHAADVGGGASSALPDPVLLKVFEFLAGPAKDDRKSLGAARAACRRWRPLATEDSLWSPIVHALWPVLGARTGGGVGAGATVPWAPSTTQERPQHQQEQLSSSSVGPLHRRRQRLSQQLSQSRPPLCGGRARSYHGVCAYRGRCLADPGVLIVGPNWPGRYRLSFEMHDLADGLCLFSGDGPMVVQEWHNQHEHRTILRLGAGADIVASPFSAHGRHPSLRDLRHYFEWAQRLDTPSHLFIRVVAIDQRTGREALLYESSKDTDRHCQDAAQGWPVPAQSLAITDHAGTWLCPKRGGAAAVTPMRSLFDFTIVPVTPSPPLPQAAGGGGGDGDEAAAAVDGEDAEAAAAVSAAHRLYQVHTGRIDPPTNTVTHTGIVGLVFLAHVHEVGLLLGALDWL